MACLVIPLRFFAMPGTAEQIRHQFSNDGAPLDAGGMVRAACSLELKSRIVETSWERLKKTPLPAIAELTSGRFVIIAKVAGDAALIQDPKGVAPKPQWLELKQLLIESREDLEIQRHKLAEANVGLKTTMMQMEKVKAEAQKEVLSDIVEVEEKIKATDLQLRKALRREVQQRLRAPVDGYVQQLQVHTIGGVVQPAQILMMLVPKGAVLEVEAMVLNKDRGFVEEGQVAEIKLESFPFTKYSTIDGTVTSVSGDAIEDEKQDLVYAARIKMAKATIEADGRTVRLGPGMASTVEIKTGKRRIIEFVMAPLLRYKDESLRER